MTERSLTRNEDWRRVQTRGTRGRCDHLSLKVLERSSPDLPSRLGLRIRSEGAARAVERNRARRRLREAWNAVAPPSGWDAVVSGSAQALNGKTYQELTSCLGRALDRAQGRVQ
jgi:ribonuclease P protein component